MSKACFTGGSEESHPSESTKIILILLLRKLCVLEPATLQTVCSIIELQRCLLFCWTFSLQYSGSDCQNCLKSQSGGGITVSWAHLYLYWSYFPIHLKIPVLCSCRLLDFTCHLFPLLPLCQYLHISSPLSSLSTPVHLVFVLWKPLSCPRPSKDTAGDYRKPVEAENPKMGLLCHI